MIEEFYNETATPDYNGSDYDDDVEAIPCSATPPGFNTLVLTITYMIVFVFGTVGNSVVIYVICFMKKGRSSTDIYVMHLAFADLLFSFTLPFWAINANAGWIFGNALCKIQSGFQEASVYSSVFLLACISVDRHLAIVRATRVLASRHALVKVLCSVVWVGSGLLSLPVVIQRESMQADDFGKTICYENLHGESSDHWRVGLRVLRHVLGFFLPMVVMAVSYGWTLGTLFRTRDQKKHKAIHVILAVVLAFVLCWLPYNIALLIDSLIRGGSLIVQSCEMLYRLEAFLNVTQVLAFVHCAVNPVLYAFVGQKFRKQLRLSLYDHGIINRRSQFSCSKSSVNSAGSNRSRNTSTAI